MKYVFLIAACFGNIALAESTVNVVSAFQANGSIVACNGTVTKSIVCSDLPSNGRMSWTNTSLSDWAGTVLRAQLDVASSAVGTVVGSAKFSYTPENKLVAIAIKQSSGDGALTITGQIDDFTDVEGRRIISLSPGRTIEIEIGINVSYSTAGQSLKRDFMVEVEPVEYVE